MSREPWAAEVPRPTTSPATILGSETMEISSRTQLGSHGDRERAARHAHQLARAADVDARLFASPISLKPVLTRASTSGLFTRPSKR
jgi:hypothetical protein